MVTVTVKVTRQVALIKSLFSSLVTDARGGSRTFTGVIVGMRHEERFSSMAKIALFFTIAVPVILAATSDRPLEDRDKQNIHSWADTHLKQQDRKAQWLTYREATLFCKKSNSSIPFLGTNPLPKDINDKAARVQNELSNQAKRAIADYAVFFGPFWSRSLEPDESPRPRAGDKLPVYVWPSKQHVDQVERVETSKAPSFQARVLCQNELDELVSIIRGTMTETDIRHMRLVDLDGASSLPVVEDSAGEVPNDVPTIVPPSDERTWLKLFCLLMLVLSLLYFLVNLFCTSLRLLRVCIVQYMCLALILYLPQALDVQSVAVARIIDGCQMFFSICAKLFAVYFLRKRFFSESSSSEDGLFSGRNLVDYGVLGLLWATAAILTGIAINGCSPFLQLAAISGRNLNLLSSEPTNDSDQM